MEVIKNSVYNNIAQCYGCSMCTYLCPKDAINMKKDEKGFFYPEIDTKHCIDCGMCISVCPVGREEQFLNNRSDKCMAIKNNDEIRLSSSSGGIYTAITDTIFEKMVYVWE